MMNRELVPLIMDCIQEIGDQQDVAIPTDLSTDAALFGESGLLDSLGLVNLVVAVEQAIEDDSGVSISLTDQRAMSQKNSPYRTISSLADYARGLLQEAI